MADNQYQSGYLKTVPTINKMTVTNLVNFAEAGGVYGETNKNVKRVGLSALIIMFYLFLLWSFFAWLRVWWVMLPMSIVLLPLPLRLISLIVFKEREVAKDYKKRNGSLALVSVREFFSCFDISEKYPYFIYHTDGSVSVVLELVRRTQVGDYKKKAFNHAEVLSSFYNTAFKMGIEVTDLDIQSSNTKDTRFDTLYTHLSDVKNTVIESILASLYQHLEFNSTKSVLSYEYFVLRSSDSEETFEDNLATLISSLQPGYKRVSILPEERIATLISSLLGLESFAIQEAMQEVAASQGGTSLKLLWVANKEGKRKHINESQEEIKAKMAKYVEGSNKTTSEAKETYTDTESKGSNPLVNLFEQEGYEDVSMTSVLDSNGVSEPKPSDLGLFDGESTKPAVELETPIKLNPFEE